MIILWFLSLFALFEQGGLVEDPEDAKYILELFTLCIINLEEMRPR
jgi:hypothetical protein